MTIKTQQRQKQEKNYEFNKTKQCHPQSTVHTAYTKPMSGFEHEEATALLDFQLIKARRDTAWYNYVKRTDITYHFSILPATIAQICTSAAYTLYIQYAICIWKTK